MSIRFAWPAGLFAVLLSAMPAWCELGPCRPGAHDMLVCGDGIGSAHVVADTVSPDKKLAFAWRDPKGEPGVAPPYDHEFLLIRLADGAVLAKGVTDYFHTGQMRANRFEEIALWSPDSRFAVRVSDNRYGTQAFTLYAFGADGALAAESDLRKIVEPALQARLKRGGRDPGSYSFSLAEQDRSIGNGGKLGFHAVMAIPKKQPLVEYRVEMKIARVKTGVRAKVTRIRMLAAQ